MTPRAAEHERERQIGVAGSERDALEEALDASLRSRRAAQLEAALREATSSATLQRLSNKRRRASGAAAASRSLATSKRVQHAAAAELERDDTAFRSLVDASCAVQAEDPQPRRARALALADRREELAAAADRIQAVEGWIAAERRRWDLLREQTTQARHEYTSLRDMLRRLRRQRRLTWPLLDQLRRDVPAAAANHVRPALTAAMRVFRDSDSSALEHRKALDGVREAIDEARAKLVNVADAAWPELHLGRARPADVVDVRMRVQLRTWGLTDREIERARNESSLLRRFLSDRKDSAARHARRRAANPRQR